MGLRITSQRATPPRRKPLRSVIKDKIILKILNRDKMFQHPCQDLERILIEFKNIKAITNSVYGLITV